MGRSRMSLARAPHAHLPASGAGRGQEGLPQPPPHPWTHVVVVLCCARGPGNASGDVAGRRQRVVRARNPMNATEGPVGLGLTSSAPSASAFGAGQGCGRPCVARRRPRPPVVRTRSPRPSHHRSGQGRCLREYYPGVLGAPVGPTLRQQVADCAQCLCHLQLLPQLCRGGWG